MKPRALVVRTAGTNCDRELVNAFELAGASVETLHLNELLEDPAGFDRAELIGLPGGFSFGDDLGAGKIVALLFRNRLYESFRRCLERGVPVIAPCNGFQVLVKAGLLPGPDPGEAWPAEPPEQSVTLGPNAGGRFIDDWVGVEVEAGSSCIWTKELNVETVGEMLLPIAHGEGRFLTRDAPTLSQIEGGGRVALRYADGQNLNGSENRIAGISDASGLVLGLMPHPERFVRWSGHPYWTRLSAEVRRREPLGLRMFRNAVEWAAGVRV